ncbi:MAG TPA: type II toxin-antitoxin system VapC family toxin [Candidatus Obscuribacterales bacterium]
MKYLLDANAIIAVLNSGESNPARRARMHKPNDIGIPSIVVQELYYGAFKSKKSEKNVALVDALQFEVLEFDKEDARQAGEVRARLAAQGKPIGPYAVLIAGQARARNLILVTHNVEEFSRVPGLKIEDWEA